jgi:steroid 5-alpha reductase family enzyme
VMTILLTRVSGKAMLERDIAQRRPQYADYIERTSGFFPRPPKRK